MRYASQAASPCINMLEQLGFDDTEIKTLLKGGKFKLPKRLGAEKFDCREAKEIYVHERIKFIANQHNTVVKQYMDQLREQEEQENNEELRNLTNVLWANGGLNPGIDVCTGR